MTPKKRHQRAVIEYDQCLADISKLKKRIPYYIGVALILPFLFPFLPGRRGRVPLIDRMEYHEAVIFGFVIMTITVSIVYGFKLENLKKNLKALQLKKHLANKAMVDSA
ncbi:hypothetical protein [Psychroflexus montanilacus]|uniref:hypothetical protein n=1 Tax=Psychroflexus montanilacus TaxID=2873598 RepID=UPI001CCDB93E|nr:hypothetical protein [Psychroflexus montanilacus]MBZ9652832.1 hypothetical protein [Psychroflexus montanilacus]